MFSASSHLHVIKSRYYLPHHRMLMHLAPQLTHYTFNSCSLKLWLWPSSEILVCCLKCHIWNYPVVFLCGRACHHSLVVTFLLLLWRRPTALIYLACGAGELQHSLSFLLPIIYGFVALWLWYYFHNQISNSTMAAVLKQISLLLILHSEFQTK
jgi:hypothetical protein